MAYETKNPHGNADSDEHDHDDDAMDEGYEPQPHPSLGDRERRPGGDLIDPRSGVAGAVLLPPHVGLTGPGKLSDAAEVDAEPADEPAAGMQDDATDAMQADPYAPA